MGRRFERFQSRMQPFVYQVVEKPLRFVTSLFYDVHYEGVESIPCEGPCLIASKHERRFDPLVVGLEFARKRVHPLFLMRHLHFLGADAVTSGILGWVGGRKIMKRKEIRSRRSESRQMLKLARAQLNGKTSYVHTTFSGNGHVIFFPEGKLLPREMGQFEQRIFTSADEFENQSGKRVSYLPVGVEYVSSRKGKIRANVRFGEPLYSTNNVADLVSRCEHDVRRLSNL